MAKISINGEQFDFDGSKQPLSEALEIESVFGMRYAEWETELAAGSMRAMCGLVWKVWHRDGRAVTATQVTQGKSGITLQDIVEGNVDVELNDLLESLVAAAREADAAREAEGQAPKETGSGRGGSPTTKRGS